MIVEHKIQKKFDRNFKYNVVLFLYEEDIKIMIGNKIYELRKNANISQEQLAEKLNITRQTISNWETNLTIPDFNQVKQIAKYFKINLDELDGKNENNADNVNILWINTKKELKKKLSPLFFDTWIKNLEFISLKNGTLTLMMAHRLQLDFLNKYMKKIIIKTFNENKEIKINNVSFID